MERYEKYKDSGVEWIGEIPNDWAVTKISSISACITGFAFKSEQFSFDEGVKLVRGDNVTEGNLRWGDKTRLWKDVTPDLEKFYLAENDIVIGMDGSKVGKNYALVQKDELPLLLVQRVTRIRSKNASFAKWIEFAISSYDFKYYVNASKTDPAIPHITLKDIYDYKIFLPPSDKIDFIVEILSKKLSELDTLITKKEKLIELLKEERTAIINQAVTKGLDPDVEMQDSGVEWLGEIPAHWIVSPLKFYCNRITDGAHISPDRSEEIFPFVSTVDIADGLIDFENCIWTSTDCFDYLVKNRCQPFNGDVLFSKDGTIGRTCIIDFDKDFVVASSLVIISPNPKYLSFRFLDYVLNSSVCIEYANMLLSGSALRRISITKIANMPISFPSLEEQFEIVKHLQIELEKLKNIEAKTNQEITLLKEYKTALISEVVTGKVKVI